jgi:hypothetical protein
MVLHMNEPMMWYDWKRLHDGRLVLRHEALCTQGARIDRMMLQAVRMKMQMGHTEMQILHMAM